MDEDLIKTLIVNTFPAIRKIMAKDIEIEMEKREGDGFIIDKDIVLEILKELTEKTPPVTDDKDYPYETA